MKTEEVEEATTGPSLHVVGLALALQNELHGGVYRQPGF